MMLHMNSGLHGPLPTTYELTSFKDGVNKYARCGYTNATYPELDKNSKNIENVFRMFPYQLQKNNNKIANL